MKMLNSGKQRSLEVEGENQLDDFHNVQNVEIQQTTPRVKRKRKKSSGKCYDFRDYGVDARRRSAKHQRRKQNLCDLLQMVDHDDVFYDDDWLSDDHMTAFAELFIDDQKMKAWECFINLPEDKQEVYLDNLQANKMTRSVNEDLTIEEDEMNYLLIDKKIRDMLRSKNLAHDGLLKYYEDDVISCMEEWFPSVLVMELDTAYDRMLVYALCQYMKIPWNTLKMDDTSLIEIELPGHSLKPPEKMLTHYIKNNMR